jgi:hypothetical protein
MVQDDQPSTISYGDYHGSRISDGSYTVSIGAGTQAHAGHIEHVGWWWASFRTFPYGFDVAGDTRPPELLGYALDPADAIKYYSEPPPAMFGPSYSPPSEPE